MSGSTRQGPRRARLLAAVATLATLGGVLVGRAPLSSGGPGVPGAAAAGSAATAARTSGGAGGIAAGGTWAEASGGPAGTDGGPGAVVRPTPPPPMPGWCEGWPNGRARADLALAGRYWLGSHPVVDLGLDPTWREDPLGDRNWQFVLHSQYIVLSLLSTWVKTGDVRYYDRAEFLLRDWYEKNPVVGAPSIWSWNDHSAALRAVVYACASRYFPNRPWMTAALDLHGRTLADASFYVGMGNHALNQSIGLLEVGAVVGRPDWESLAAARIASLIRDSVDAEGATNEQSTGYHLYNLSRYRLAEQRLIALGQPLPPEMSRLDLMPNFLAHATLPNGYTEMIGDSEYEPTPEIAGTWAQFAASGGARGPKPTSTFALYQAGYLFARSGWGETRPFADEVFTSLRFGPARFIHGHADGTAVTLYGYGSRLLVDPGKFNYNDDPFRQYFIGRTAHNVVAVDGLPWSRVATTALVGHHATATMIDATVTTSGYSGVFQRRRMTFSRRLNYMLVEDSATATVMRTFRQLWHLDENAAPVVARDSFRTMHARGNLLVRQLIPVSSSRVVTGATSPIQGWVSYHFGARIPAPVVEVTKTGTAVRFVTLLVPAAGRPKASVTGFALTPGGYSVTIAIGPHAERVVVDGTGATITTLR